MQAFVGPVPVRHEVSDHPISFAGIALSFSLSLFMIPISFQILEESDLHSIAAWSLSCSVISDNILLLRFLGFKIGNVPLCNGLGRVCIGEKQSAALSEIIIRAPVVSGGLDIGGAEGLTYISSN